MERLPVFELIDQTVKILNDNRKMLETYADVLHDFFHRVLDDREESRPASKGRAACAKRFCGRISINATPIPRASSRTFPI